MYDIFYGGLVKEKIAVRLPELKWVDGEGNTVPTKDRAVGHMVEHELTHAEYLLFVGDVVNNTNQNDDKQGNNIFLGRKGRRICQSCATDDNRFTVLVWTAATIKVVIVAVIFYVETLRAE